MVAFSLREDHQDIDVLDKTTLNRQGLGKAQWTGRTEQNYLLPKSEIYRARATATFCWWHPTLPCETQ